MCDETGISAQPSEKKPTSFGDREGIGLRKVFVVKLGNFFVGVESTND